MITKKAVCSVQISELIASRWSPRAFDLNKKVTREQIISICEAGRWAPSCFGDEPWRFIVLDREPNLSAFTKAFNCIGEWNQKWIKNVQVLFIVCADTKFRKGKDNFWGAYDTGAASENIYLQSFALGLAAHPIAGFDKDKVRKEFGIPEQFNIMALIAIGYQGEIENVDDSFHESELAERKRRNLGTEFFDSSWENPLV